MSNYSFISLEINDLLGKCDSGSKLFEEVQLLKDNALKVAKRSACLEERQHYSKIIDRYKSKAEVLSSKVVFTYFPYSNCRVATEACQGTG